MPASATNKTNVASIKTAIATLRTNASTATGTDAPNIVILCDHLLRDIRYFELNIQDLN